MCIRDRYGAQIQDYDGEAEEGCYHEADIHQEFAKIGHVVFFAVVVVGKERVVDAEEGPNDGAVEECCGDQGIAVVLGKHSLDSCHRGKFDGSEGEENN